MYRMYEDPVKLEERLEELNREYERIWGACEDCDDYRLYEISCEIQELKDRINFAWQDDEYDEDNAY